MLMERDECRANTNSYGKAIEVATGMQMKADAGGSPWVYRYPLTDIQQLFNPFNAYFVLHCKVGESC
jgi:hypothetical protein